MNMYLLDQHPSSRAALLASVRAAGRRLAPSVAFQSAASEQLLDRPASLCQRQELQLLRPDRALSRFLLPKKKTDIIWTIKLWIMQWSQLNESKRTSFGGGPSTVIVTKCSPRRSTRPSMRFSSFSSLEPFGRILRNSSQSPSIRFMCLSKALNVPTNWRLSCRVTRIR